MRVYSAYYKETQAMLKLIKCGQIYQQSNHPHNSEGSYRCGSAHFTDGQEYSFSETMLIGDPELTSKF